MSNSEKGLPLVMIHGLMGKPENWQYITPFLPKDCHPITLKLPLFDKNLNLNSVEDVLNYVQGYLENLGLKRMVLMGNSLGAHLAALLSLRMPQEVTGIVLISSGGIAVRGFTMIPGARPPRAWIYKKACEVFYKPPPITDEIVDDVMELISDRRRTRLLINLAKSIKRANITEKLKGIQCPTLLVWGRQDKITPPPIAEQFHKQIPNSELVWIDECGHAPMIEHPKEFSNQLNIWWEKTFAINDS